MEYTRGSLSVATSAMKGRDKEYVWPAPGDVGGGAHAPATQGERDAPCPRLGVLLDWNAGGARGRGTKRPRGVWHSPFRREFCVNRDVAGLGVYEAFVLVVVVLGCVVVCDDA